MKAATRIRRTLLAAPLRGLLALWLACGLLLAPAQAAQHALAMTLGADICTSADQPGLGTSAVHDCCVAGLVAAMPPAPQALPAVRPDARPQAAVASCRLGAEGCACPPARGPPGPGASLLPPH